MDDEATDFSKLAAQLPIPAQWNRTKFIDAIAEQRDREIRLVPVDTKILSGTSCGLWAVRETDDLIVYGADTSDYHADQIICHEVGHMVLGHDRCAESPFDTDLMRTLLPSIPTLSILKVLGRNAYETRQERDAETFADRIMIEALTASRRRALRNTFFRIR